jgi:fermentation-respiration switch protein FrsA (DUF1100 family)
MVWLAAALILGVVFIGAALGFSFLFTQRSYLSSATHSPAELGLPFENITFLTSDGLTLHGWWVSAAGSDRAILQLHGHAGSMDPDLQYVPAWHAAGLNVCLFDFRAHGRSPGRLSTFGYLERLDVQAAVRWLAREKGVRRIALVGFSLGGMVAMLAAPICPEVNAVVEDGAPVRIISALKMWCLEHHLPRWSAPLLACMTVFGASLRLRANLFQYEPVRWVGRIAPRPLMLIHGEQDQYCPDFDDLLQAAQPTEVWRVPGVGHVQASQVYPEEYRSRVLAFLNRYL